MNSHSAITESVLQHRSFREALRETFSEGRRFWERGRLAYNVVLLLVSVGFYVTRLPESRELLTT